MTPAAEQLHLALVTLHALAATAALVAGVVAVHTGRGFRVHVVGLVVMALALGPSLAVGWPAFPPSARVAFAGLAVLAVAMVGQTVRAVRIRRTEVLPSDRPVGPRFVGVLGVNLVALTVAGTVVPVLRAGGGAVGVVVAVLVTVVLGHLLVARRVRAVTTGPPELPAAGLEAGPRAGDVDHRQGRVLAEGRRRRLG